MVHDRDQGQDLESLDLQRPRGKCFRGRVPAGAQAEQGLPHQKALSIVLLTK
jgi:hypothetical protein